MSKAFRFWDGTGYKSIPYIKGEKGDSAYAQAVAAGYAGTLEEFTAQLNNIGVHMADETKHVTSEERTSWSQKIGAEGGNLTGTLNVETDDISQAMIDFGYREDEISLGGNYGRCRGLQTPTENDEAASKQYVDSQQIYSDSQPTTQQAGDIWCQTNSANTSFITKILQNNGEYAEKHPKSKGDFIDYDDTKTINQAIDEKANASHMQAIADGGTNANTAAGARANLDTMKPVWAEVTLPATGWTPSGTVYVQTVACTAAAATMKGYPNVGLKKSTDTAAAALEKEAFALIETVDTADGSITATCGDTAPQVAITLLFAGGVA